MKDKYFKHPELGLFLNPIVKNHTGLVEISKEEYDELLISINAPKPKTQKQIRDESLEALTHDFGDGRVMQVRPSDEQVVTNAIKLMTITGETTIDWVMLDDKKYPVTIEDLQAASLAGLVGAAQIWLSYNPEV